MGNFTFNKQKSLATLQFLIEEMGGHCDFHKCFKILYFADQKHLLEYGRPILGDTYIAMKHGPVPSKVYDIFKSIKGIGWSNPSELGVEGFFEIKEGHNVFLGMKKANYDEIAISEKECLLASIKENGELSFRELTEKSHDQAWEEVNENDVMSTIEIAKAAGASEEFIDSILKYLPGSSLTL